MIHGGGGGFGGHIIRAPPSPPSRGALAGPRWWSVVSSWESSTESPDWLPEQVAVRGAEIALVMKWTAMKPNAASVNKHQNGRWSVPTETAAVSRLQSANQRLLLLSRFASATDVVLGRRVALCQLLVCLSSSPDLIYPHHPLKASLSCRVFSRLHHRKMFLK